MPLRGADPSAAEAASWSRTDAGGRPLLVEFAELWHRGLADDERLWQLFDISEMYLHRPDYFGAPVFNVGGQLVSPVFSTRELLAKFMIDTGQLDAEAIDAGFDWIRLPGRKFFGLPVRARYLFIDPGSEINAVVDLRSRTEPPELANGAPPVAINLEVAADGALVSGVIHGTAEGVA